VILGEISLVEYRIVFEPLYIQYGLIRNSGCVQCTFKRMVHGLKRKSFRLILSKGETVGR